MKTTIVDYQLGNFGSIVNMHKYMDIEIHVSSDPKEILNSDKIILPGVGNFKSAMFHLSKMRLIDTLNEYAMVQCKPLLGICLGMQLLFDQSEEGNSKGLSMIPGKVKRLEPKNFNKVPNMGWSRVNLKKTSKILTNIEDNDRFYFVHSYYADPEDTKDVLMTSKHFIDFCCGVERKNIFGFQFHPEKSHKFGLKIFENFAKL